LCLEFYQPLSQKRVFQAPHHISACKILT
jgi:hypothetical protein